MYLKPKTLTLVLRNHSQYERNKVNIPITYTPASFPAIIKKTLIISNQPENIGTRLVMTQWKVK